jgi:pimeloyl-ACP methyl ester carboxylesterase
MHSDAPTLFLHGGPGFSAMAERTLYGHQLPIHWWDQPRSVIFFASPFDALVSAAQEELGRLATVSRQPVNVVAHAFGAHLVLHLASRVPEQLGKILLLAPVYDLWLALMRLANQLHANHCLTASLRLALAEANMSNDYLHRSKLAGQLMGLAMVADPVWRPDATERRHGYKHLLAHESVVDLNTFEVVVKDFWTEGYPVPISVTSAAPVHVAFGHKDALLDVEAEQALWTGLFPQAVFHQFDCGHFVHLELPPTTWWTTR